jgi:hypothetical protein
MIKREQVLPLILEACPSFRETWNKSDNQELPYVVMGDLARHLLSLYCDARTDEFRPLCAVIERLQTDGDGYVREFATVGFLEAVQNVWSNNGADPEAFCEFLLPESRKWWKELNDFWAGKIPYVGAGLRDEAL